MALCDGCFVGRDEDRCPEYPRAEMRERYSGGYQPPWAKKLEKAYRAGEISERTYHRRLLVRAVNEARRAQLRIDRNWK